MPTNIYSTEPAPCFLAHSLLRESTCEAIKFDGRPSPGRQIASPSDNNWHLEIDSDACLCCRKDSVFRGGSVVGISRLRETGRRDDYSGDVGELSRSILAAHLRQHHSHNEFSPNHAQQSKTNTSTTTTAFIIHPANNDAFAPETLLASLLAPVAPGKSALNREEAIRRLDSVQLLPVYDFPSVVRAVARVSDALAPLLQQTSVVDDGRRHVLLLVAGLDALAEGVIRASNPIKGAALAATTLRMLTVLSRRYTTGLCIVLVNTRGVGSWSSTTRPSFMTQTGTSTATTGHRAVVGGIQSVFHAEENNDGPLFPSLLMRVLDQGVDTHFLLSNVGRDRVVEVIKDRTGDRLGSWCVWGKR